MSPVISSKNIDGVKVKIERLPPSPMLPAIFLMDEFFPFTVSSWQLGLVDLGLLLFPQAFGLAALILAYLTHQYGQLMKERGQMKKDLERTI
ncbi:MAG TPA: hypothetical protein VM425_07405 [Myxococcota bacterium]|nr:hypothetical protein [Myxococcota bacterium]